MTIAGKDLAAWALTHPEELPTRSTADWDMIVRQSRSAQVLARLAAVLEERGLLDAVPDGPGKHLTAAQLIANRQHEAVHNELECIRKALVNTQAPIVLLKGAAYVISNLPAARGRVFGDIDILVPKERLPDVEAAFMLHGWMTIHHSAYDQRYYREWMHEIPPLRHIKRGTVLDVHHNILPETCRVCPQAQKLLDKAQKLPGSDFRVLAPEDMVLHSAAHLFLNGEFEHGLRDLSDMDLLLREFSRQNPHFWNNLLARAHELKLIAPLFFALRYASRVLKTPVPEHVLSNSALVMPRRWLTPVMDALFQRALLPNHTSCRNHGTVLARWLLFLRSHWIRMPTVLLVKHLARKSWERWLEILGWDVDRKIMDKE